MPDGAAGSEVDKTRRLLRAPRLGRLLVDAGHAAEPDIARALTHQRATGRRLGEILTRRGWADGASVAAAAAAQARLPYADLAREPLDPSLGRPAYAEAYLALRQAPWRASGGAVLWAVGDRSAPPAPGREHDAPIALCDPDALAAAIIESYGASLAERAAARPAAPDSARSGVARWQKAGLLALAGALAAGAARDPAAAVLVLFAALVTANASVAALRVAALVAALRPREEKAEAILPATPLADRLPPPRIALLVPLLREPETVPILFEALENLDWPAELLDVLLILEGDDLDTKAEIERLGAPPFCRVVVAPPGEPRTKPRAMNLALDAADGEIVGVYDAEDRPEADQLRRVVEAFRNAPPEVACVQARLAYFNARENWITRCFAIEYAIWFDVLLGGFRRLGLPIPLGGTSVFFRRAALEEVGAWDAHNVTEDADLGMRLARAGYRCEVIGSTTYEEANGRALPWIRQRSRWLKGYAVTWLTHMRSPARLLRELGLFGFLGFQAIFLGSLIAYFGLPLFWGLGLALGLGWAPPWASAAPPAAVALVVAAQLAGWGAMMTAALVAVRRRGEGWLAPWIPTLALYWPLGAGAAYLALVELFVAPTRWRKTTHGVGRVAAEARRDAMRTRWRRMRERRAARRRVG